MLKLHAQIWPLIAYKVETMIGYIFWFDNWHLNSPLLNSLGPQVICTSGIPIHAKLSTVISNGQWNWPPVRSQEMAQLISSATSFITIGGLCDIAQWLPTKSHSFTINSAWNFVRAHSPKVAWSCLAGSKVSFQNTVSFAGWLILIGCLLDLESVSIWGTLILLSPFVMLLNLETICFLPALSLLRFGSKFLMLLEKLDMPLLAGIASIHWP